METNNRVESLVTSQEDKEMADSLHKSMNPTKSHCSIESEENVDVDLEPSNFYTEKAEDKLKPTSPGLVCPQKNKENVDSLCEVENPTHEALKEHEETEDSLYKKCEPTSHHHMPTDEQLENTESSCKLECSNLMMAQDCKDFKEDSLDDGCYQISTNLASSRHNAGLFEPEFSTIVPFKKQKIEDNPNSVCHQTFHIPILSEESKGNMEILCDQKSLSSAALKDHSETQGIFDGDSEPTPTNLEYLRDKEEDLGSFCKLESISLAAAKGYEETLNNLNNTHVLTSPSPELHQENRDNVDNFCELASSSLDNKEDGDKVQKSLKMNPQRLATPQVQKDQLKVIVPEDKTNQLKDELKEEANTMKIIDDQTKSSEISMDLEEDPARKTTFQQLVERMNMEPCLISKITLRHILSIGIENVSDKPPKTVEDLPWNYLRKVMALNRSARDILLEKDQSAGVDDDDDNDNLFNALLIQGDYNSSSSIHPLDVLCLLLHCSDSFLQKEIFTKMSMCQFAVPLLLPSCDGSHSTLMLGAMRDIVKKWRPHSLVSTKGFIEKSVVNASMPIFSFVRLGKNKLSKSKILNQVLNSAQLHNNFFIHDNMDGGNIERKISDGLVEMSWYFPCGKSDVFPEPIAVTNLRGDLETNLDQFMFLTQVSSAVFIFFESISEKEFRFLLTCPIKDTQYYFIVTPGPGKTLSAQTLKSLQDLSPILNLKKANVINTATANEAAFVNILKTSILGFLKSKPKERVVSDLEKETRGLHIKVDENVPDCQKAEKLVREITREIKDVSEYKTQNMVLQGELWKQLSKVEKEFCRMTNQGGKDSQLYQDELRKKHISLHEQQYKHNMPCGLMLFIDAITHLSKTEKQHFLKWMKSDLDSIGRDKLSKLQDKYKDKCNDLSINKEELKVIDQKISDSSLGVEHFLREMGQFYEAECSMVKENKKDESQRQFTRLPGIAADLLLDGFPLELLDGDASNIPLRWITDVLTELDTKTGNKCRMRVITVLGVQSTGKSTLLNTMFGLQFPVASGRCTRGAFMTLLHVQKNFQEELGCEFILVIDTEGLKAPELASLEGSYEHDNELATLVIGLSDITIVNMAMENTTEMKDILQIVVHAFLRMKEVGKKPNCQFVHQNVSDVSAHVNNMRDRQILLGQMDKMTKVAAEMENKCEIQTFSDVMDYNLKEDNCYIPGLWLGVPPMAPVNSGYSEHVSELKKHLLELMKTKSSQYRPLTIPEFKTWIESLWNAVKHEKFLFSFRNSLVVEAYNKLCMQFSQWEWEFRKSVYDWLVNTETSIRNQPAEGLNENLHLTFSNELGKVIIDNEMKISKSLEDYFDKKQGNVNLIERYKQDFALSIQSLSKELKMQACNKCNESISIQKGKFTIENIKSESQKQIESKITALLQRCREKKSKLKDEELLNEFEKMWGTTKDLQMEQLQRLNISSSMLQQLKHEMRNKGPLVNQELLTMNDFGNSSQIDFTIVAKYINSSFINRFLQNVLRMSNGHFDKVKSFANSLIDHCNIYVIKKVKTRQNYDNTYCQELLRIINTELSKESKNLHLTPCFELSIKRHIFRKASEEFQTMHDLFIRENDPKRCLEALKPSYLKNFMDIFHEKDVCQTKAKEFCDRCLKPAMMDYIFRHLGQEIVNDIVCSTDKTFSSRIFFQDAILRELLGEMLFEKYISYLCSYKNFTKKRILNYLIKYAKSQNLKYLQEELLSRVYINIRAALREDKCLQSLTISDFLKNICETLNKELVIPQNEIQVVLFQNTAPVGQFSLDIRVFLQDTKTEILSKLQSMAIKSVLSKVKVKPEDELFRRVAGCGKQCPFCKVPCEAGGDEHKEHFASIHRPKGLGRVTWEEDNTLSIGICSTSILTNEIFRNSDTEGKWHPYKEYRTYYPDWAIQPDVSIECSDYWKFIFQMFNEKFAKEYNVEPAKLPDGWKTITKDDAFRALDKVFII